MSGLGAKCLVQRCDVDQEDWNAINVWYDQVMVHLDSLSLEDRMDYLDMQSLNSSGDGTPSRNNPFMATIKVQRNNELSM